MANDRMHFADGAVAHQFATPAIGGHGALLAADLDDALCWRAALTMIRPSRMVNVIGFSTYTSLPAWQAWTECKACQ